ncbi:MAG: LamG-like jellyroll fold domain-containing protein [bacterium]
MILFKINNSGQSLLEVIVAMAIFGLITAAMVSMVLGSFYSLNQGAQQTEAEYILQEGFEAVRAIRDRAWNISEYSQSGVTSTDGWQYLGEGTTEQIGKYRRIITFFDVCRDLSGNIADCPANYIDPHTKRVRILVRWQSQVGSTSTISAVSYISNWDSIDWTQTNWVGGSGQSLWSNETQYDSDDGGVDVTSIPGSVTLAMLGGGKCEPKSWQFATPSNYSYDPEYISVTNGFAQLNYGSPIATSSWEFSSSSLYNYDQNKIEVGGSATRLILTSATTSANWEFTSPINYIFSSSSIELDGGVARLASISGAIGEITDTILGSSQFLNANMINPSIVNVTGTIYAVAYEHDSSNDGFLITINIAQDGTVGAVIDTEEYDSANGMEARIIKVGDNVVAIVYRGSGADGFITTYSVSDTGIIGDSPIDSLEFAPTDAYTPEIISVGSGVYGIVYRGPGSDGFVSTVGIDSSGNIGSVIDSLEFYTSNTRDPIITHVSGEIYAIAYEEDSTNDGFVRTVSIASNGQIGSTYIDQIEYDTANGFEPDIISVSSNMVAVAYRGTNNDGFLATIGVDGNGLIADTIVDNYEYSPLTGYEPDIISINNNVYAIVFGDPNNMGSVSTVEIQSNGQIIKSLIDTIEYNTFDGDDPQIISANNGLYIIVHQGETNDGYITTIEISDSESFLTNSPDIYPDSPYTDNYVQNWISFVETAVKESGSEIYYQLSSDNGLTWQYWAGSSWSIAVLPNDYNTAITINANIFTFSTSTGQILFKAFLSSNGTAQAKLDNVNIGVQRSVSGYPMDSPTINPMFSLILSDISSWASFEHITSGTGSVFYQLSSDNGSTWQYWSGSSWTTASLPAHYNIASTVNSNITSFTTSTGQIMFRAFLMSNGVQQIEIQDIIIGYRLLPPDANTMGLWHFDEISGSFIDQTSNQNDLLATGNPTYQQTGKFNSSVLFDNNGDYGQISDSLQNGLDITGPITIDAWINKNSNGNDYIVSKWGTGNNRSYYLQARSDGSLRFEVRNGGSNAQINSPASSISTGQWHHVAAVYDGTYLHLFIDGISSATPISYSSGIQNGSADFYVSYTGATSFDGYLDEVRISNMARWTSNFVPPSSQYGSKRGFPTNSPTISPKTAYIPVSVDQWTSFIETASSTSGTIYYQLSANNGNSWQYWDGSAWSLASITQYNTATTVNDNIWQFSTASGSLMFKAFIQSNGNDQIQLDQIDVGCSNYQFEVGTVSANDNWNTVNLINSYSNPVIVASYYEFFNTSTMAASIRVSNVSSTFFDVRLQSPSTGVLNNDQITYFVIEEGKWDLGGINLEAGLHETDTVGYSSNWDYDTVLFERQFTTDPIVMHSVMSYNDSNWITSYISNDSSNSNPPDTDSFRIALNGAQAVTTHATETIAWIAIERDLTAIVENMQFETLRTGDVVTGHDDGCFTYSFQNSYSSAPLAMVFQQEMDGNEGSWGVMCDLQTSYLGMHAEEDQEGDSERSHTSETFGYIAFGSAISSSTVQAGGSGYAMSGELFSSAFDMTDRSPVQVVEWDENLSSCEPNCQVRMQARSAPDNGGIPGSWTNWYGSAGSGTYFTSSTGSIVPNNLNGNQWMQYRFEMTGNGITTPILEEVRLNYK